MYLIPHIEKTPIFNLLINNALVIVRDWHFIFFCLIELKTEVMKLSKILTVTLSLATATFGFSQNTSIGITGGYQLTSYDAFDFSEGYNGANIGVTGVYSTQKHWGVGGDLLFSRSGGSFSQYDISDERVENYRTQMDHIRLVPKFHVFFRDLEDDFRPTIFAGPGVGFLVRDAQLNGNDRSSEMKPVDFSGTLGAGFHYQMIPGLWLHANTAYTLGFVDLNKRQTVNPDRLTTNNWSLNIGVAYSLKKAKNTVK